MIGEDAGKSLTLLSGITLCGSMPPEEWQSFWPGLVSRVVVDLDEAGNEDGSRMVAALLAEMWDRMVPPMSPAQEYELAGARFDTAARHAEMTRKSRERDMLAAEAEWEAARANLRRFEVSPGIPKPEFDPLREGQA
ncbi:MAG: hypothetical protein JWM19_909 [Actinomycetia bacterium]|nr:hypothetical protein [Actinomycetes bacterium]